MTELKQLPTEFDQEKQPQNEKEITKPEDEMRQVFIEPIPEPVEEIPGVTTPRLQSNISIRS